MRPVQHKLAMKGNVLLYCFLGLLLKESWQLKEATALHRINSSHWMLIRDPVIHRPVPHVQTQVDQLLGKTLNSAVCSMVSNKIFNQEVQKSFPSPNQQECPSSVNCGDKHDWKTTYIVGNLLIIYLYVLMKIFPATTWPSLHPVRSPTHLKLPSASSIDYK